MNGDSTAWKWQVSKPQMNALAAVFVLENSVSYPGTDFLEKSVFPITGDFFSFFNCKFPENLKEIE